MSERKCFSKHQKLDEQYEPKTGFIDKKRNKKIRFMLPINIQCKTCNEKIPKGKKINVVKENIIKKQYHGLKLLRFYLRCFKCLSGSSLITDLQQKKYKAEINCFEF